MFSNREDEQTGLEWGWDKDQGRFRFLPDRIIAPAEIVSAAFFSSTIPSPFSHIAKTGSAKVLPVF